MVFGVASLRRFRAILEKVRWISQKSSGLSIISRCPIQSVFTILNPAFFTSDTTSWGLLRCVWSAKCDSSLFCFSETSWQVNESRKCGAVRIFPWNFRAKSGSVFTICFKPVKEKIGTPLPIAKINLPPGRITRYISLRATNGSGKCRSANNETTTSNDLSSNVNSSASILIKTVFWSSSRFAAFFLAIASIPSERSIP